MEFFRQSDLAQLLEAAKGPCVSLYMPTHIAGEDQQQDRVRLKNLVDQAERELSAGWMRAAEARQWMETVAPSVDDQGLWEHRSRGLVLFADRHGLRCFRLPIAVEELVVVGLRFHIKPLLPLLNPEDRFLVLALSQHRVQLLEATQFDIQPVDVALPQRMEEALNLQGADPGSQSHFSMAGGKGKATSVFHGQGGEKDTHKEELTLFFRQIDEALQPVLRDERAPLVLAGVDYLLPIYREVNSYPRLADEELNGNCDRLSPSQIHEKCWPLVAARFAQRSQPVADEYQRLVHLGKATDDLRQSMAAAFQGRIGTLLVAADCHLWGAGAANGDISQVHDTQQAGDDDLLDVAAAQTLAHGGTVYALPSADMPSARPLAAVMRY